MYRVTDSLKNWQFIINLFFMITYVVESIRSYISNGIHINPFFLVFFVAFFVQWLKVIIDLFKYRKFRFHHFFSSWGFPSFHTWLSSCVTMLVLLEYGFDSVLFVVVVAFSLLFAYDAMNLRFQTWQHAHVINKLRVELQWLFLKETTVNAKLKERIGHTPLEVLWWFVIWSLLTYVLYYLLYI